MLYNVIFAFAIPLILLIWLYKKNDRIVLTITPVFSVVSFIINHWGVGTGHWWIIPVFDDKSLSSVPYNIGIYPALSSFLAYLIHVNKRNSFFWVIAFTTATTGLEMINLQLGRLFYGNGWNVLWTFISYLIPYSLTSLYYRFLKNKGLFDV